MKMKSSEVYASTNAASVLAGQPTLLHEGDTEQSLYHDGAEMAEDEWLRPGCIQGDHKAWEDLIDKYKRLIFSIPIKYGASSADAADVFQSVCIEVMNCLPQLKNVQSLRSWLITVTIRQSYRWKKKQSSHVELDAMEPDVAGGLASIPPAETLFQLEEEQI